MKILLTGCDGQVGWEICRQAPKYNFSVIPTDVGNLDITDLGAVRALQEKERADIIINSAAYTAVDKAESDQELANKVNALGAQNLALVAAESNIPILHISTDYIFDGRSTTPYLDESTPAPQSVYGKTKLAGEQLVSESNPKFVTLRTSWVFGIEGNNFVKTMLRIGNENDEISVVADQFGSPTFAGHIARALLMLADQYNKEGDLAWGNYNFCDSGITTWHGFASKIMDLGLERKQLTSLPVVRPIRTEEYPTPAVRPNYSMMDCNKFAKSFPEIGIQSWETGLVEMLDALKPKGTS
jgi:dTDP-4-dehydrorhamnose reductase